MHLRLVASALVAASAAFAQTAGAKAVITKDALPVYPKMSASSEPAAMLDKGARVTIGLVLFGDDVTWCAVSKEGETRRLGFVSCEFLEPDRSPQPAAPAAPAVESPKPPAAPVKVREVQPAPMKVTELAPPRAAEPPRAAAPKSTPVKPEPVKPEPVEPEPVELEPAKTPPVPVPPKREPARHDPAPALPATEPPVAPQPQPMTASQILERSGAASQIALYVRGTNFLSYLDKGRLAAIDGPAVRAVIGKHFQVSAFHRAIAARISSGQPPARATWLEEPQAAKLSEMTKVASTAASRDELVAYAAGLRDNPPTQDRLLLIHRLHEATRSSTVELESTITAVRAVAEAINPGLPAEKRFQRADLDQALATVRATLEPILKNARIVHYLFTFRAAGDEELEEYVRFWESTSGQWLRSAIEAGFGDATRQIGGRLKAEIPPRLKTP